MAFGARILSILGVLLLTHAVYSAYEHSLLSTSKAGAVVSGNKITSSLPLDIQVETILSTLILTLAIVLSSSPLRPIRWREWAGRIEREGWDPSAEATGSKAIKKGGAGNPYRALDDRKGFWDIRAQRKDFADWVRQSDQADLPAQLKQ